MAVDITTPQVLKFKGAVEKVFEPGQYDAEFVVSEIGGEGKYVNKFTFKCSTKNEKSIALINQMGAGSVVEVQFRICGKSGISKAGKYYHMNELRVTRDGLTILSMVKRDSAAQTMASAGVRADDIPF